MYPGFYAAETPDKPAAINATTGEVLTYAALEARSARLARCFRAAGLASGDAVALLLENRLEYFVVAWAALRAGLYLVTVNRYSPAHDAAYVIGDSGAKAVIASDRLAETAARLLPLIDGCPHRLMMGVPLPGWTSYDAVVDAQPAGAPADEPLGDHMPYSSGTTGKPKGIRRPLPPRTLAEGPPLLDAFRSYGFDADTVYLSPAPLYHTAPFSYTNRTQVLGGTVVMMERFDAVEALRCIERYHVTHSQWVPTMFVRMLKLPEAARAGHDLSSHRVAIHAAAPCPVEVKRRMIDWWGPILHEYYAGSERNGATRITSAEWLARPGSVGRATMGRVHICDDDGRELPPGADGVIYFEQDGVGFSYHNDPAKTREARHPDHPTWSTMGDVGHLDDDGYLYLTDRKSFMIISGGVNIYPQMIEDALVLHPMVADVAVIGVPDEDLGEAVKAVVQTAAGVPHDEATRAVLTEFARGRLAHYMVPKSIDFTDALPRLPTGKLYKKALRDAYWKR